MRRNFVKVSLASMIFSQTSSALAECLRNAVPFQKSVFMKANTHPSIFSAVGGEGRRWEKRERDRVRRKTFVLLLVIPFPRSSS